MIRLTNEQWERIRKHFPEEHIPDGRPGRKPIPTRHVLEAVLWILNTGAQWHMLPQCYPNYKTVHRRFQTWCRNEILRRVLTDITNELRDKGALDEEEVLHRCDVRHIKGGGSEIGTTKRGKGSQKIMAIVDAHKRRSRSARTRCEPSRSPLGAAMLRLLHDRSQAEEIWSAAIAPMTAIRWMRSCETTASR